MEAKTSILPTFEPGSWREWLAAMALFLLLALTSLLSYLHIAWPSWVSWVLFGVPLLMLALGLIKGLPRWSLPYTGVIGLQLSWVFARRGTMMGINTRGGMVGSLLRWTDRHFFALVRPSASDPSIVRAVYGAGELWFVLLGMAARERGGGWAVTRAAQARWQGRGGRVCRERSLARQDASPPLLVHGLGQHL